MGFCKKDLIFCLIIVFMMFVEATRGGGVVYKVGGSSGWSNVENLDYMGWARNKTFHVGDKIVFEYNKTFQNVLRVTHQDFNNCNATEPMATFNSGNDTFDIQLAGHYFFICGIPGHCESGQKVDIRVPRIISPTSAPANSPAYSPSSPKSMSPDNSSPSLPKFPKARSPSPASESLMAPSLAPAPAPAPAHKSDASIFVINKKALLSLFVLVCFV